MKTLIKFLGVLVLLNVISLIAFGQAVEETEDYTTISVIGNLVLTVLGSFFGALWNNAKSKLGKVGSLLDQVNQALADNNITNEEIKAIIKSAKEVTK